MRYSPSGLNECFEGSFAFNPQMSLLAEAIGMDDRDIVRLTNYYTRRGVFRGGLRDRLKDGRDWGSCRYNLDENGKCLVWYVCFQDYHWFRIFMERGDKERAGEIIDAMFRYAMTDEYYMLERYNQRDPYFAPWMPNASANGRMINMLLDYYA